VDRFAETIAREVDGRTLPFLTALCGRIHDTCAYVIREDGDPLPGEETLARGAGSCRDLAVLFMDACRARGIAARFVSGYQEGRSPQDRSDMHAWSEVYLPGGGWRGYDPTLGLAVADRHIALASAAVPQLAAPISGSFRGADVSTSFQAKIEIRSLPE
jgi:transglutaminase-like putative cysteine protease